MGCLILDQPLAVAKIGPQSDDLFLWSETAAKESIAVKLTDPLRVIHVGLSTGNVLRITCVHEHDLKASSLEDLVNRDPVHARRLHRDRGDPNLLEPVRQSIEISCKTLERANRFVVCILGHSYDMERRADIQTSGVPMNDWQCCRAPRFLLPDHHWVLLEKWLGRRDCGIESLS